MWTGEHFSRSCPHKPVNPPSANSQSSPINTNPPGPSNFPKTPCPRCQKGLHWAKECKFKFHKNGTLLISGQQPGNVLKGQPQAPATIGVSTLNPFIPFVPSQSSSEQPQQCSSTTSTILTPDSPTVMIPTGIKGPLLAGFLGIILNRSSIAMQGPTVVPGVIDSDFTGEIHIMISPPSKTTLIYQGQRIARLLLLLYATSVGNVATQSERKIKGFCSSDVAFWVTEIAQKRPMKNIFVSGKPILGLLDTGADISCIAGKDWPSSWPTHTTENDLIGLGKALSVVRSAATLKWQFDNTRGNFQPYVVPSLPFTLWGRDALSRMGMPLYSPDEKVTAQMLQMGYDPSKGLGKHQERKLSLSTLCLGSSVLVSSTQIYNGGHCSCCRPYRMEVPTSGVDRTMAPYD